MLIPLALTTVIHLASAHLIQMYVVSDSWRKLGVLEEIPQLNSKSYFGYSKTGSELFHLNNKIVNRYGPNPERSLSFDGKYLAMTSDKEAENVVFSPYGRLQTDEKLWSCNVAKGVLKIFKKKKRIMRGNHIPNRWWCRRIHIESEILYETVKPVVFSQESQVKYRANVLIRKDADGKSYLALSTTEPYSPLLIGGSKVRNIDLDKPLYLTIDDGRLVMDEKEEPVRGLRRSEDVVSFTDQLWICDGLPNSKEVRHIEGNVADAHTEKASDGEEEKSSGGSDEELARSESDGEEMDSSGISDKELTKSETESESESDGEVAGGKDGGTGASVDLKKGGDTGSEKILRVLKEKPNDLCFKGVFCMFSVGNNTVLRLARGLLFGPK